MEFVTSRRRCCSVSPALGVRAGFVGVASIAIPFLPGDAFVCPVRCVEQGLGPDEVDDVRSERRRVLENAVECGAAGGDEFIGPAEPEDGEFDDYPTDEHGALDFEALFEDIDLEPIVERNDPLTLEEIGLWEMKSTAKEPAKVASLAMKRAGLKPHTYLPHPESNRPQAIFLKGAVVKALANRPRQGSHSNAARGTTSTVA